MKTSIIEIGNSKGSRLPKPILSNVKYMALLSWLLRARQLF